MSKRLRDEARVALLREILMEEVPHTGDDWVPPADEVVELLPPPTIVVSAVGGRAVVVDEGEFVALLGAAGVPPGADISKPDFGRLLAQAKGGQPLLAPLLAVRSELAPLYRVKNSAGRPWRPTAVTTAVELHPEHPAGATT